MSSIPRGVVRSKGAEIGEEKEESEHSKGTGDDEASRRRRVEKGNGM